MLHKPRGRWSHTACVVIAMRSRDSDIIDVRLGDVSDPVYALGFLRGDKPRVLNHRILCLVFASIAAILCKRSSQEAAGALSNVRMSHSLLDSDGRILLSFVCLVEILLADTSRLIDHFICLGEHMDGQQQDTSPGGGDWSRDGNSHRLLTSFPLPAWKRRSDRTL